MKTTNCQPLSKTILFALESKLLSAFDVTNTKTDAESQSTSKPLKRTPADEVLLTELALDDKNITIYDITSAIFVAEKIATEPYGQFKCFLDHDKKQFYIEIDAIRTLEAMNKSTVLNLLTFAENLKAEKIYVCCRKTLGDISYYLKTFMFIGFSQLSAEEQKEITMTQTHYLLSYSLEENGDF